MPGVRDQDHTKKLNELVSMVTDGRVSRGKAGKTSVRTLLRDPELQDHFRTYKR